MIITKYNISTSLHKTRSNKKSSIRLRVTCKGARVDLFTGISVDEKVWSKTKGRVKAGYNVDGLAFNLINDALVEREEFVRDFFNECAMRDVVPDLVELGDLFNRKFKASSKSESVEFFYLFDQYLEVAPAAKNWKKSETLKFNRIRKKLEEFNPNLKFSDLSEKTMTLIMKEFSKSMYDDALEGHLRCFKRFVKWASLKKIPVNDEYWNFNPPFHKAQKDVQCLNSNDLKKIQDLQLDPFSPLDITRDVFLFSCCVGQRYSDIYDLKKDDVFWDPLDGKYKARFVSNKTNKKITCPLFSIAESIYLKHKDRIYDRNALLPCLQEQPYNRRLKELGKLAELEGGWKTERYRLSEHFEEFTPKSELTSHVARRTFVTLALSMGVPAAFVTEVTGHEDEKAMKPYKGQIAKGASVAASAVGKILQDNMDNQDDNNHGL